MPKHLKKKKKTISKVNMQPTLIKTDSTMGSMVGKMADIAPLLAGSKAMTKMFKNKDVLKKALAERKKMKSPSAIMQ